MIVLIKLKHNHKTRGRCCIVAMQDNNYYLCCGKIDQFN